MPNIINTNIIDTQFRITQNEVKEFTQYYFRNSKLILDRMTPVFENAGIKTRQFVNPKEWFYKKHSFFDKNSFYISKALELCRNLVNRHREINIEDIDNIIFVSSTGLSTPSIDALLINELKLNNNITRTPIWGLGCVGGAVGLSRAFEYSLAYPEKLTLLISLELCSLAFLEEDHSKSNFIAMALFSDGAASALISGKDNRYYKRGSIKILKTHSTLYYDSIDVMGWEFVDSGLKAIFSKDIPNLVKTKISKEYISFLNKNSLDIKDIKHFLLHPGGTKIINEFEESLNLNGSSTKFTRNILKNYGNMSSPTVIYVIDDFLKSGEYTKGELGLIASLGPGFSSEVLLFEIQ